MLDRECTRWRKRKVARVVTLFTASVVMVAATAAAQTHQPVTFTKDIAPILQRSCQQCHRPDSIAPMSLLTYEQVRPYARAIKQRTQQAYVLGNRGVMPPWFIERNIGIQQFKEDTSLSDAEIAAIARWADSGAPMGNPADMPPPLSFADNSQWFLGKPDLIVSSPPVLVKGVGADWWGDFGETPTGLTEDRYAQSVEYKETSDLPREKLGLGAGAGATSIFVFHHASATVVRKRGAGEGAGEDGEGGGGNLSLHEVGRNGDVFPQEAGKLVPAGSFLSWNAHLHSPGIAGADQTAVLHAGLKLHPVGYKPKYQERSITFGRSELDFDPQSSSTRFDAYWVAPQPVKLLNYEPHMHATGVRKCMEAIYGGIVETLNCAGYDHNWVKNYQYDENAAPLLPKGTILHAIGWFDNSVKNPNNIEPRNAATYGASSVTNMFILFNKGIYLTEEQYQEEIAKRREYLARTQAPNIGCPDCYAGAAPAAGAR